MLNTSILGVLVIFSFSFSVFSQWNISEKVWLLVDNQKFKIDINPLLTLIWVRFLGVRFKVCPPPSPPPV